MKFLDFKVRPESESDQSEIERLTAKVFGPGIHVRAVQPLREGVSHEVSLSFVAEHQSQIIGSVRLTKIMWGKNETLMLGPLAVLQRYSGHSAGKALMRAAVSKASDTCLDHQCKVIILVGNPSYYELFGFKKIIPGKITLPRPTDPERILAYELREGALSEMSGPATRCLYSQSKFLNL